MTFDPFQIFSSLFQKVILYHSNSCMLLCIQLPTVFTNGSQMMSYSHVEKDLNMNEHLNPSLK